MSDTADNDLNDYEEAERIAARTNAAAQLADAAAKRSEQAKSTTPLDERDEWRTPAWLYAWAVERFGPFDFDLAASDANALCDRYFTRREDSLRQGWCAHASRAWCNPPYSDVRPWIEKAIDEAQSGLASTWLIPAFRGDVYHAEHTQRYAAEIVLISPRVAFIGADGKPKAGNTGGNMLVHFNGQPAPPDHLARITIETIRKPKR